MSADFLDQAARIVGHTQVLTDPADTVTYLTDWRGRYQGHALAVLRPGDTDQAAALVRLCHGQGIAMVPQGGNTGLCGGATPDASGRQVVLALERLNRIRNIDLANANLVAEAGCRLAQVQAAATAAQRLFPLSLAAEGSCTIGGNISTNAGGTAVLRYGNMRDLVLGLEVVLPDGQIWHGLRGLRKDNTGYDLKHWFIGAEGTLGVVTAATLKLYPMPTDTATALLAITDPAAAVDLLERVRQRFGDRLVAYEMFSRRCLELVLQHIADARDPLDTPHAWYVLLELADVAPDQGLAGQLTDWLAGAPAVTDGTVAASHAQRLALWALRENMSEAQKRAGVSIKHDISVPISRIADMVDAGEALLSLQFPGCRVVVFGHIGDGNLHYNVSHPDPTANSALIARSAEVNQVVHDLVASLQGSISAEHGIGQLKRDQLPHYKSPLELDLMLRLKQALDPSGLMNPGKVL